MEESQEKLTTSEAILAAVSGIPSHRHLSLQLNMIHAALRHAVHCSPEHGPRISEKLCSWLGTLTCEHIDRITDSPVHPIVPKKTARKWNKTEFVHAVRYLDALQGKRLNTCLAKKKYWRDGAKQYVDCSSSDLMVLFIRLYQEINNGVESWSDEQILALRQIPAMTKPFPYVFAYARPKKRTRKVGVQVKAESSDEDDDEEEEEEEQIAKRSKK
eukprot:c4443_g1_i1.p1 GENE.c4443_g1_i1~~c4443_g1_i1.p1  ORF type:complete len:215 (+),score=47.12 c4443_g1_i1:28-672(+)